MREPYRPVATVCIVPVRTPLMRKTHWPVAADCVYHQTDPKVGCRRRNYLSACWEPTPLQLRLQDNPNRSGEVGRDTEKVGNVRPANRRPSRL